MPTPNRSRSQALPAGLLLPPDSKRDCVPIWLAGDARWLEHSPLDAMQKAWLEAQGFSRNGGKAYFVPAVDGKLAGVAMGPNKLATADPMARAELAIGSLPPLLPTGAYRVVTQLEDCHLAGVAWGLGAYRFTRYKAASPSEVPCLKLEHGVDPKRTNAIVEAVWLGRDLINTPSSDMGPQELEEATRSLAKRHNAKVTGVVGDDLLAKGFPMIHAVGRASQRAPRLIDLTWGPARAPRVTLVGKGICFDTGGLDIKPASGMLLMKKDMGGAAAALALGHMIMSAELHVALRVLIPAAENSISGNALRPLDVLKSRSGLTIEVGNTDAEGRLVLADALALADEQKPEFLLSFATLTGAARVALGPDLPPFYTDDDAFAGEIAAASVRVGDPVWRMPFWSGYESYLDSTVADMNNVSDGPFAGSVTAALFLRRFVKHARRFAHFDIYGWRPAPKPLGPKGGEPQAARAVFEVLEMSLQR